MSVVNFRYTKVHIGDQALEQDAGKNGSCVAGRHWTGRKAIGSSRQVANLLLLAHKSRPARNKLRSNLVGEPSTYIVCNIL